MLSKLSNLLKRLNITPLLNKLLLKFPNFSLKTLLPWINRFGVIRLLAGKHASLTMYVMSLIVDAYEKRTMTRIVREVYKNLPDSWKAPVGPATEDEINQAIKQGVLFARCLTALSKK